MLGQKLKTVRESTGLTQREVATTVGISREMYAYIECGTRLPSLCVLVSLANLYNCSIDTLLEEERKTMKKEKLQ